MSKRKLKYFICYARKTEKLAIDFLDKLKDHSALSKNFEYEMWIDGNIIVGENWDEQIQNAIKNCDFGLLLLSAPFFSRPYIKEKELVHFISNGSDGIKVLKPIVPIGLQTFNLGGDLLGLEDLQIFRYKKTPGIDSKFYSNLRQDRDGFVQQLLTELERKFKLVKP